MAALAFRCLRDQTQCDFEVGCVLANTFLLLTKTTLRREHGCETDAKGNVWLAGTVLGHSSPDYLPGVASTAVSTPVGTIARV